MNGKSAALPSGNVGKRSRESRQRKKGAPALCTDPVRRAGNATDAKQKTASADAVSIVLTALMNGVLPKWMYL